MNKIHTGKYSVAIRAKHTPIQTTLADWDIIEHTVEAFDTECLDNVLSEYFNVDDVEISYSKFDNNNILTIGFNITLSSTSLTDKLFVRFETNKYDKVFEQLLNSNDFFWHCENWELISFVFNNVIASADAETNSDNE